MLLLYFRSTVDEPATFEPSPKMRRRSPSLKLRVLRNLGAGFEPGTPHLSPEDQAAAEAAAAAESRAEAEAVSLLSNDTSFDVSLQIFISKTVTRRGRPQE